MKPFTKLFSSIVTSSIWRESNETRIVWVTLLALADKNGEVWASVGGLAHAAGVDREACAKSLDILLSPDPDSRTKDHEGRRIVVIDGGWRLLNYIKYREMGRAEDRREYFAEHKRKSRASKRTQLSTLSTSGPPLSPIAEAEAEADIDKTAESDAHQESEQRANLSTGSDADLWRFGTGSEAWVRTLKRAGCKIGPNNWRAWQGLIDRAFGGDADACAKAAATVKPEDRWPDQVEAAKTEQPSATASKYAKAKVTVVKV